MSGFDLLKVETDFGITFQAAGLLHYNRSSAMGKEYYYPAEVPADVLHTFKERAKELTALGVREVLFRYEAKTANMDGLMNLVFEAELGPEWEQRLSSPENINGSRSRIAQVFTEIKKGLWNLNHQAFDSILEPPSKDRPYGCESPQETWHARLWCGSKEFPAVESP